MNESVFELDLEGENKQEEEIAMQQVNTRENSKTGMNIAYGGNDEEFWE